MERADLPTKHFYDGYEEGMSGRVGFRICIIPNIIHFKQGFSTIFNHCRILSFLDAPLID
jgi:hypothetical protein